jgi:hypothetical protein
MATDVVVEEVANNLEEASRVVRHLNPRALGYGMGGICIGIGIGFLLGQRWRKEQSRKEAFQESEKEIEEIRQHFFAQRAEKVEPKVETTLKPDLDEVVQERGYSTVEVETEERPLPPPVPVYPPSTTPGVPRTEGASKDKYDGWNYPFELSQRNWRQPHIIHQDEFASNENDNPQTTYTYYEGDNILADTDESILENPESHVGPKALRSFGHGTDDFNIVYVRNPQLELDIEVIRHTGTYAEEVQGLEREHESEETTDD